jgi:hypothetical protein
LRTLLARNGGQRLIPEILSTIGAACQMVAGVAAVLWIVLEIGRRR